MTPPPTAPYLATIVLLAAAGVAKVIRPSDTATALRTAGIPAGPAWVRAGAGVEVVAAAVALVAPSWLGGSLIAATYLTFAGFIVLALYKGWALASCGCFGRPDTPPTRAHAVLNCGAAAAAIWWAAAGPASGGPAVWGRLFVHSPWHGGPLVLVTAVVVLMAYLLWSDPIPAARR
jgi:hypothetical protein